MKIKSIVLGVLLTLPVAAQSPADLLQKGIYAQETAGDLDSAIQIFRQVANPSSNNKGVAAQAQYQLVLCMLQRGDRPGAAREVETLARNFPDQPDLVTKARKLLPGGSAILPAPWGEGDCSQFNIKRDGVATGEHLYYSIDPTVTEPFNKPAPNLQTLRWELTTKKSKRSVLLKIDRTTGQVVGQPDLSSNDIAGDPSAEPLAGPAIDIQLSVFAMRRLPLAVGYKTTLTTLPLTLSHLALKEVELSVTGIEPIEVTAGKFKCYKVSFASLGQTFWYGVEGSRPLVKFKSGNTEFELMKLWGPENLIETELKFFRDAGWKFETHIQPGPQSQGGVHEDVAPGQTGLSLSISATKVYTPAAEIPQALRDGLPNGENYKINNIPTSCRSETIQTRVIGGQQAISCVINNENDYAYHVWIRTEGASFELKGGSSFNTGIYRWRIDQILATAKRIP